jgi:glycosyltransferase involved in cell wall biosynthesis
VTKFSVLVPTRNRVEYLQQAVESVLCQDYGDWEICIADNMSSDSTREWVEGLDDARILYSRSEQLIPVTDNWNRSLFMSSGDYVVMIGDDDAILRGYFTNHKRVIDAFGEPDAIYSKGLLFSYPGVIPGRPEGSLQACGVASFMTGERAPSLMSSVERRAAVADAFRFRMSYPFNMQLALVSRKLITRLGGSRFFQSPYPDYFAMNRVLLEADRMVKLPVPLVAVGATKKSFGYFYFNGAVSDGVEFLQNGPALAARTGADRVAGSEHLDSWLCALEALLAANPKLSATPDYRRYRRLQFGTLLRQLGRDNVRLPHLSSDFWATYPMAERIGFSVIGTLAALAVDASPRSLRRQARRVVARAGRQLARETTWPVQPELMNGLQSMSEVVARVSPDDFSNGEASGRPRLDATRP